MRAWLLAVALALAPCVARAETDPFPSWNNGAPTFVPPAERIATFDNDGTLWVEQPLYVQLVFVLDRVKALAPGTRRTVVDMRRDWRRVFPFENERKEP